MTSSRKAVDIIEKAQLKSDLPVLVAHEVCSQRTKPVPRYVILAMQKWSFLLFLILLDN